MRWLIVVAVLAVAAAAFLLSGGDEPTSLDREPARGEQDEVDAPPVLTGSGRTTDPASSTAPASGELTGEATGEAVARLVVRVTQEQADAPLEGADVRIFAPTGWEKTLRTPTNGEVEFVRGEAVRVFILVTHAGLVASSPEDVTLVVGKTKTVVIRLKKGVGVQGVVLQDEDGSPVVGAHVGATDGGRAGTIAASSSSRPLGVAQTDGEGRFRFAALPPDEVCTVIVRAEGFSTAKHAFFPKDVTGQEDAIVLRLKPGARLVGRVFDPDGQTVVGARVRLGGKNNLVGVSDADGAYAIDGLELDRRYPVAARARGFATSKKGSSVLATAGTPKVVLDLTLRRSGALRVRLVDGAGKPIVGQDAKVWVGPWPSGWRGRALGAVPGGWRVHGVDPGSHRLEIKAPGYRPEEQRVTIREGAVTERVVTLRAGTTIAGVVVDDQGKALPKVRVKASLGSRAPVAAEARTDENGRFRMQGLNSGTYEVDAYGHPHDNAHLEGVPAGTTDVRIVLTRPAKVTFQLRLPTGVPRPDRITIDARRSSGMRWQEEPYEVHVGSGGALLMVTGKGFAPWSTELDLAPGEEADLGIIRLDPGVTLTVRVADRSGSPVPAATVSIIEDPAIWRVFAPPRTEEDGTCALLHLNPGVHEVEVVTETFLRHKQKVEVSAGGTSVTLTLDAGGLIDGEVLTASGAPASSRPVRCYPLGGAIAKQEYWHNQTDARGHFKRRLPTGRYRVDVGEEDRVLASAVVVVTERGTKSIKLRLDE